MYNICLLLYIDNRKRLKLLRRFLNVFNIIIFWIIIIITRNNSAHVIYVPIYVALHRLGLFVFLLITIEYVSEILYYIGEFSRLLMLDNYSPLPSSIQCQYYIFTPTCLFLQIVYYILIYILKKISVNY